LSFYNYGYVNTLFFTGTQYGFDGIGFTQRLYQSSTYSEIANFTRNIDGNMEGTYTRLTVDENTTNANFDVFKCNGTGNDVGSCDAQSSKKCTDKPAFHDCYK